MKVIKVTPRGYCKGVTRAIALARKTAMAVSYTHLIDFICLHE